MNASPSDPVGHAYDQILEMVLKEPLLMEILRMKSVTLRAEEQSNMKLLEGVRDVQRCVTHMYLYVRQNIIKEDGIFVTNETRLPRKYKNKVLPWVANLRARLLAKDKEWDGYITALDALCNKITMKQASIVQLCGIIPKASQIQKWTDLELQAFKQEKSWMDMQQVEMKLDFMIKEAEELHDKMGLCYQDVQIISNEWMVINSQIDFPL